jgi:hypothetical protein
MSPDDMDSRNEDLRRRAGRVPRRLQASIDRYRLARGLSPLWTDKGSSSPSCPWRRSLGRPGTTT